MTNAKDFASKFAVAIVAVAMLFTLVAPAVQAAEAEDLQTTINDLLAQVAALQSQLGDDEDADSSASCEAIAAPLTMGSTGANVTALQNRLIADGEAIAAGATGYFGAQTKAALASWQGKNSVSPAVGYYGPITMAAMAADCDDTDAGSNDDDDDTSSDELSGEGTLDVFEIDDAADGDIEEGAEDVEIAELTLEASDGDIEVDRVDLTITTDGDNTENDPWEVFETITLWVDGEMVAEFDASDEDEYLDEDDGTFRFTNVGLVLMEDEEVEVTVGATVAGSVDDAGVSDEGDWTVAVDEVRYFDADGVADDNSTTGDLGDTVGFDIVEAGEGEELMFSLGDNNPDSTDIVVDEDDETNGVTVLEYTIEAEEGDIEINELRVNLETGTESIGEVVDDVMLVIDGDEFDAETAVTTGTSTNFVFDIDGDVVIDADSEVTVEVVVDFKSQSGNYAVSGETIQARVTSALADLTDAEGSDDIDAAQISGSAVGDLHTLVSEGIIVPVDGVTTETDATGDNNQTGEFSIEFEVTAVEGDFYIVENAGAAVTTGVQFLVETAAGTSTASGVLASTADEDTDGIFTVRDGETETFTLTVTVDTNTTTQARVTLTEVNWSADEDGDGAEAAYVPTPASDFRTGYQNINAN